MPPGPKRTVSDASAPEMTSTPKRKSTDPVPPRIGTRSTPAPAEPEVAEDPIEPYHTQFQSALPIVPTVLPTINEGVDEEQELGDLLQPYREPLIGYTLPGLLNVLDIAMSNCGALFTRQPPKNVLERNLQRDILATVTRVRGHLAANEYYGGKNDYQEQSDMLNFLRRMYVKKIKLLHQQKTQQKPPVSWDLRDQELCICLACFGAGRAYNDCVSFKVVGYHHHTKRGLLDPTSTPLDRCVLPLYEPTTPQLHVGSGQTHGQFQQIVEPVTAGVHYRQFWLNFVRHPVVFNLVDGKWTAMTAPQDILDESRRPEFLSEWLRAVAAGAFATAARPTAAPAAKVAVVSEAVVV